MAQTPPQLPDSALAEKRLHVLHSQLERMRAMHYKYSDLFYKLVTTGYLVLVVMAAASMTDTLRGVALVVPFYVIYVGTLSAYFLSYVVLARVYATGIEQRVNKLLGEETLIAHRLEAAYLYPLSGPQFAGVQPRLGQTFIGFLTIHFWLVGAAAIALSAYRAWQLLALSDFVREFPPARFYFAALAAWSLLHLVYLAWYFATRRHERRIMSIVADAYGTDYEKA